MKSGILALGLIVAMTGLAQAQTATEQKEVGGNNLLSMSLDINGMLNSVGGLMQAKPRMELGSRVLLNDAVSARIYESLDGKALDRKVNLPAQSELEVLALSADGKVAQVGIDTDDASFSDMFVSIEDVEASRISMIDEVAGAEDDEVDTGFEGLFKARRKKGGMTYCYRDVKTTLLKNKKCGRYASGVRAAEGYSILARECGMKQVGLKIALNKLPPNAVCVSSGGRPCGKAGACGHIAIKLKNGMWYGAGTRPTPWLGDSGKRGYKKRVKVGCLIPR